ALVDRSPSGWNALALAKLLDSSDTGRLVSAIASRRAFRRLARVSSPYRGATPRGGVAIVEPRHGRVVFIACGLWTRPVRVAWGAPLGSKDHHWSSYETLPPPFRDMRKAPRVA